MFNYYMFHLFPENCLNQREEFPKFLAMGKYEVDWSKKIAIFFMAFVWYGSGYEKWSARARFGLLCARVQSDQAENLHVLLKLAVLSFLFWRLLSQTAPCVVFMVVDKKQKTRQDNSEELEASLAPAKAEVGALAKADQQFALVLVCLCYW